MKYLDQIDDIANLLAACNNLYKSKNGLLTGTNTDWIGVRDSLLSIFQAAMSQNLIVGNQAQIMKAPAFVIGAGGAARAAVYALTRELGATKIYVINRDVGEFDSLMKDITTGYQRCSLAISGLVHLRSPEEAVAVEPAFYGVGTVLEFEAVTEAEIKARRTLTSLLQKTNGVFLDMCYKPRQTRNLLLAKQHGWVTGHGAQVVAWQFTGAVEALGWRRMQ